MGLRNLVWGKAPGPAALPHQLGEGLSLQLQESGILETARDGHLFWIAPSNWEFPELRIASKPAAASPDHQLTAKQIQTALFPSHHDSRCQLRLTLLSTNKYIDVLPNRLVNQPAIYLISRKCRNAFDLLREYWTDEQIKSSMLATGSI